MFGLYPNPTCPFFFIAIPYAGIPSKFKYPTSPEVYNFNGGVNNELSYIANPLFTPDFPISKKPYWGLVVPIPTFPFERTFNCAFIGIQKRESNNVIK